MENNELNLANPKPLPKSNDPAWMHDHSEEPVPYVFVADEAFPLGNHYMKPYSQRNLTERKIIFHYCTSRMRCISENVFGIWSARFRIFFTTMMLDPDKVVQITLATIVLHNLLREKSKDSYIPPGFIDEEDQGGVLTTGSWREESGIDFVRNLPVSKNNHPSTSAENIQNHFTDHFYGPGQIPWQWNILV